MARSTLLQIGIPLGSRFDHGAIVTQKRDSIVDGNQTWDEFRLKVGHGQRLLDVVLLVDSESHLPHSMKLSGLGKAQDAEVLYLFNYPDEGPVDVYALGVPRSTKVDDRVPPAKLGEILRDVKKSREEFDSYRAFVVKSVGSNHPSASPNLHLVWSKKGRWRVEIGSPLPTWKHPEPPPTGTDMLSWWKQRQKHFQFVPVIVCDGKRVYQVRFAKPGPDGKQKRSWEMVRRVQPEQAKDAAASFGNSGQFMPDLYAYPSSLGMPSRQVSVSLEEKPEEGPIGSVLVSYQATAELRDPHAYRTQSYWLDPYRGYVTMQYEFGGLPIVEHTPAVLPLKKDTYVMEEPARSPRGFWFPTVVRRKAVRVGVDDDKQMDGMTYFYVDFNAEFPDSLFAPKERRNRN